MRFWDGNIALYSGSDPGEVKWVNFHPPFSEPPSFIFFSYPSNIKIIFDFSDIITKIHPPIQNPGSALDIGSRIKCLLKAAVISELKIATAGKRFSSVTLNAKA